MSEIAKVLGYEEDSAYYEETSEKARKAFIESFTEDGEINSNRQCQYVRPIVFGLLSAEKEKTAAYKLKRLVEEMEYHLNTGFLTTPHICEAGPGQCQFLLKYGQATAT